MGESRAIVYDSELKLEAYRFRGIRQEFPKHSHEHYVIGFVERSRRMLFCRGEERCVVPGDVLLLAPGDSHGCRQVGEEPLDYRCINVKTEVMSGALTNVSERTIPLGFRHNVISDPAIAAELRALHGLISNGSADMSREELFLSLLSRLGRLFGRSFRPSSSLAGLSRLRDVVDFMEAHYSEPITLDTLGKVAGVSKYHLVRSFSSLIGMPPHRYLETVRVNRARSFLESGMPLAEVACSAGFSDQSHLTNCFKKILGITPKRYFMSFG